MFPAVGGREVSESRRVGLGRSGRLHQRGERHALAEPPEPHPPVRHRPHAAHEDGKTRRAHTRAHTHVVTEVSETFPPDNNTFVSFGNNMSYADDSAVSPPQGRCVCSN